MASPARGQEAPQAEVAAYLQVAAAYRDGRFDTARDELAAWHQEALERSVAALVKAGAPARRPALVAEVADLEALLLLHAELGLGLRPVLPDPSRRLHLDALRRLTRVPSVAADAAFTRRFRLLLGLIDQSRFDLLAAKTSFEAALLSSPGDSFALMALGRLEETELAQAMPGLTALTGGGGVQELDGGARAQLARAADLYRSALRVDPSLHEARLRLGRVLQLQARRAEASRELSAVLERTGDRNHIYLANLLLGALHEAADEVPRAVACYRAAAAANPDGTTAKMALGHALHRLGHRQEALELVSVLLSAGSSGGEAGPEAWLLYKMGAFDLEDQVATLWRELRESVRR